MRLSLRPFCSRGCHVGVAVTVCVSVATEVCTVVCTSVSVLVTVLGATVSVCTGAAPPPPEDSCLSWWLADEVVVVVVVVVEVGAGVSVELHATESMPTATVAMPTVNDARLRVRAMVNDNGISLSSQSHDKTARFIPAHKRPPPEPPVGFYVQLAVSRLS